jgi:hypothetical protein
MPPHQQQVPLQFPLQVDTAFINGLLLVQSLFKEKSWHILHTSIQMAL